MALLAVMTTFLLVRHGETDWNVEGRLQGRSDDSQLTHEGENQANATAQQLAQLLKSRKVDVWSSGLRRADKTATIIAEALLYPQESIHRDERLKEANHGRLEGKVDSEYKEDSSYKNWKKLPSKERFFVAMDAQEGESYNKVALRAETALKEIAEQGSDTVKVIVTHGGVINAIRKDVNQSYDFPNIKNGEIIVIQYDGQNFSLKTLEEVLAIEAEL